jgi:hypothetical protein
MGFNIKINHQINQSTCSHASRCHHCNHCHYYIVDFVLFHDVTCYTNYLLSCIYVNTMKLLNITCTLVAASMIAWSLECISFFFLLNNKAIGGRCQDGHVVNKHIVVMFIDIYLYCWNCRLVHDTYIAMTKHNTKFCELILDNVPKMDTF